jgi:hypothetical protein
VLVSLLISGIHAVPNVTVVPLPVTCESYPAYNATTGAAGPLSPVADGTGQTIDGLGVTADYVIALDSSRWGFVRAAREPILVPLSTLQLTSSAFPDHGAFRKGANQPTRSVCQRDVRSPGIRGRDQRNKVAEPCRRR